MADGRGQKKEERGRRQKKKHSDGLSVASVQ